MSKILEKMLDMLTGAYNRSDLPAVKKGLPPATNIGKLFALLAWNYDIVRNNAQIVQDWNDLDQAQGAVLDRYGQNAGVDRAGATDRFYRLMIIVKRMAQLSGGDMNTLVGASATMLEVEQAWVRLQEMHPAKVYILVDQDLLSTETHGMAMPIALMLKRLVAAGIWIRLAIVLYVRIENTMYFNQAAIATPVITGGPPIALYEQEGGVYMHGAAFVINRIKATSNKRKGA